MKERLLFSHKSDEWETPQGLFETYNREFNFDTDVACNEKNAKCKNFLTDSLGKEWGRSNWCNPPYSLVKEFCRKAVDEQRKGNLTVMLIPARTDTKFFHDYCYGKPSIEIRFLKGRIKFISPDGSLIRKGASNSAPFPSMIVIFNPLTPISSMNKSKAMNIKFIRNKI